MDAAGEKGSRAQSPRPGNAELSHMPFRDFISRCRLRANAAVSVWRARGGCKSLRPPTVSCRTEGRPGQQPCDRHFPVLVWRARGGCNFLCLVTVSRRTRREGRANSLATTTSLFWTGGRGLGNSSCSSTLSGGTRRDGRAYSLATTTSLPRPCARLRGVCFVARQVATYIECVTGGGVAKGQKLQVVSTDGAELGQPCEGRPLDVEANRLRSVFALSFAGRPI